MFASLCSFQSTVDKELTKDTRESSFQYTSRWLRRGGGKVTRIRGFTISYIWLRGGGKESEVWKSKVDINFFYCLSLFPSFVTIVVPFDGNCQTFNFGRIGKTHQLCMQTLDTETKVKWSALGFCKMPVLLQLWKWKWEWKWELDVKLVYCPSLGFVLLANQEQVKSKK